MSGQLPITRIRALLVGVNEYESSDIRPLQGCVNDVALIRLLLKRYFQVPNEDIRVVVNRRATKANILHRLRQMLRRAQPGEVVVFYFSGHGSQMRERHGDELTASLDEVICPYDMDWDRRTYIVDDDLNEVFAMLPAGALLEAFFDCCFWGTGTRAIDGVPAAMALRRDVRHLPPPFDIAARADGEEQRLDIHRLHACTGFGERNVAWGAAREGQESAEDNFDGQTNGIFTYWGCRFIGENIERVGRREYTRERLLEDVRGYLQELGYVQTPELSASGALRAAAPLLPAPGSGAWAQVGTPERVRRGRERRRPR